MREKKNSVNVFTEKRVTSLERNQTIASGQSEIASCLLVLR